MPNVLCALFGVPVGVYRLHHCIMHHVVRLEDSKPPAALLPVLLHQGPRAKRAYLVTPTPHLQNTFSVRMLIGSSWPVRT